MDLTFLAAAQAAARGVGELAAAEQIDFSLLALFLRATWVVQVVLVLLVLASFWSWAIMIEKALVLRRARRQTAGFEEAFWSGQPLDQLFDRVSGRAAGAIERVFVAGMTEWRRSFSRNLRP